MIWAVTSYFNPFRCKFRKQNFETFVLQLRRMMPVLVVEMALDGGDFELEWTQFGGVTVLQYRSDCLWQKERALNLAVDQLPSDCDSVLFIDGDVLLPWLARDAIRMRLLDSPVVQPFRYVEWLTADGKIDLVMPSVAYCGGLHKDEHSAPGHAWAMRRSVAERGLYTGCIVGGGDTAMVGALFGQPEMAADKLRMEGPRREHYLEWARCFAHDSPGISYLDMTVQHLWHGSLPSRRYIRRTELVKDFDPREMIVEPPGEGLRWAPAAPHQLRSGVCDYMQRRVENARTADSGSGPSDLLR